MRLSKFSHIFTYYLAMLCIILPSIHIHAHSDASHHGLASVPGSVQNIKAAADPKLASVRLNSISKGLVEVLHIVFTSNPKEGPSTIRRL